MNYLIYFFGFLPSIIWLLFYLRKDAHPESKRMILKIFFYGMLAAIPAILLELGILSLLKGINYFSYTLFLILYVFLGIALVEEGLKYLIVKKKVLSNSEFDEPVDLMLYMIIAALGFSAAENILILSGLGNSPLFTEIFTISAIRFLGATFLHALCSGTIGYFMALSLLKKKEEKKLIITGLAIAILLHGFYNLSIIKIDGFQKFIIPIIILTGLAIFVSCGFKKLKKMASICIIK